MKTTTNTQEFKIIDRFINWYWLASGLGAYTAEISDEESKIVLNFKDINFPETGIKKLKKHPNFLEFIEICKKHKIF